LNFICILHTKSAQPPTEIMRDQYAGDVSDVIKFAFLRGLAGTDRSLGVAWYYAAGHDGRRDGRHLEWRDEHAWKLLDPALHDHLAALQERSVAALEMAAIWPTHTVFYTEPMPNRANRQHWAARKRSLLEGADIVFLDPDNGIGEETEKHATYTEIALLRRPGRAIVFISFPGRSKTHSVLLTELHERLRAQTGADHIMTLRTNISVPAKEGSRSLVQRQRWFTVVDADAALIERARIFVAALGTVPRVGANLHFTTRHCEGKDQQGR
jgi:hypothetical protein